MAKETRAKSDSPANREPFTTIDDLVAQAEELAGGLRRLSKSKYPLDIRRGLPAGEEVMDLSDQGDSITVKAGAKTYFFDVKETREGKSYLQITESRFKGEGEERERVTITVFPEHVEEFGQAVIDIATKLK